MTIDDDGVLITPFLRTRYNYDMDAVSERTGLACTDPTRAQQQFKEETDINTIVERFGLTGQLPQNLRMPIQEEFVDVMDYQTALNKIMEADDAFMKMPAAIRAEFQNDAGKFVEFVTNKENIAKCREWGLAVPEVKEPEPWSVRVIADPPVDPK